MGLFYNILSKLSEQAMSWRGTQMMLQLTRGFFERKQFRAYKEFTGNTVLKMVFAKPFFLHSQVLYTDVGAARVTISTGGVESGVWVDMPTKFGKYLIEGPVAGSTTVTTGGTVTIGNEREVMRVSCGTGGNSATAATTLSSIRALPPGTYYATITVTGTTTGIYSIEWEEIEPSDVIRQP